MCAILVRSFDCSEISYEIERPNLDVGSLALAIRA